MRSARPARPDRRTARPGRRRVAGLRGALGQPSHRPPDGAVPDGDDDPALLRHHDRERLRLPSHRLDGRERERNTWETTSTLATRRIHVVTAKYLYVATMGLVAGALNAAAMVVSFRSFLGPLLARMGRRRRKRLRLRAASDLAADSLPDSRAAGRPDRRRDDDPRRLRPHLQGRSVHGHAGDPAGHPPGLGAERPSMEFTPALAGIPVVNVVLLLRQAIAGNVLWLQLGITVLANGAAIAACLWARPPASCASRRSPPAPSRATCSSSCASTGVRREVKREHSPGRGPGPFQELLRSVPGRGEGGPGGELRLP